MNRPMQRVLMLGAVTAFTLPTLASDLQFVDQSAGLQVPLMEKGRTEVELADINGNGHVDIICVGDHGSPFVNSNQSGLMVWFGDGDGNWSHFQTGYFGYGGVAVGDVNNNGIMDVGYGVHHDWSSSGLGSKVLEVALGDGTGMNWSPWFNGLAEEGQSWGMFSTDFADINNNGWLDIGSIAFGCCDGLHVYLNNTDGSWTHTYGFLGGNSAMEFRFGDFNGDGNADFAASHGSGTVWLGDGNGNFSNADGNLPGTWRSGIAIGDITGNGRDDLAWTTSNGIEVWTLNHGGQWENLSANLAAIGIGFHRAQIADMNLNGRGEIIAYRPGTLHVYSLDEQEQWQLLADISVPEGCSTAAALHAGVDVMHNGYPDIVTIAQEDCHWWTGGTNRPRVYANAFAPDQPFVHPVFPRGGETTFIAGQTRFVRWHAAIPQAMRANDLPTTTIELSTAGPDGPWAIIADGVPSNGRHQWRLPGDLPSTDEAYLRFTFNAEQPVQAVTPQAFTIIGDTQPQTPGDLNGDGVVDVSDLLILLAAWGPCPRSGDCTADINGDGSVDVSDLLILLANWG